MGEPDLAGAAATVRDVFGRMDWKGRELVALIGGGHTFGKTHGASTASPGKTPAECPFAPWAGETGMKAVTSGFEGPWTSEPTKWDNKYFQVRHLHFCLVVCGERCVCSLFVWMFSCQS